MLKRATTAIAVLLLVPPLAAPAAGQEGSPPATLPAVELPINLARVKRGLEVLLSSEEARSRLKLDFYVDVYGRAPQFNPLEGFDLHTGLVPFGSPSHADMMSHWTPQGFGVPVADLGSVLGWIVGR